MKFVVIFTCLLAVAVCKVYAVITEEQKSTGSETNVDEALEKLATSRQPEIHVDDNGHFILRLVDEDGAVLEEEGVVLTDEKTGEEVVITTKGTYSYRGENGKLARLAYDVNDSAETQGKH